VLNQPEARLHHLLLAGIAHSGGGSNSGGVLFLFFKLAAQPSYRLFSLSQCLGSPQATLKQIGAEADVALRLCRALRSLLGEAKTELCCLHLCSDLLASERSRVSLGCELFGFALCCLNVRFSAATRLGCSQCGLGIVCVVFNSNSALMASLITASASATTSKLSADASIWAASRARLFSLRESAW